MVKTEDVFKCQEILNERPENVSLQNDCILESSWDRNAGICSGKTSKESCESATSIVSQTDADMKCNWSEFRFEKDPKSGGYSTLKTPKLEALGRIFGKIFRGTAKGIGKVGELVKKGVVKIGELVEEGMEEGSEEDLLPEEEPPEEDPKEITGESVAPSKYACSLKTVTNHQKIVLAPSDWIKKSTP